MSAKKTKNHETPVLEGTIETPPPAPDVDTSQTKGRPDIIDAEYEVLPELHVGDKLWRKYDHDGAVHTAIIESVDEGGMSAHIRVDSDTSGKYEGFIGTVRLNNDGSINRNWHLGVPPEQPTNTEADTTQFAFTQSLAYKMRDEGVRFKSPEGDFVSPTGEVDDVGNFVLQVETDDGMEEKSVPPEDFIRDYVLIDENEPTGDKKENTWNKVSRSSLRDTINIYNDKVSPDQQINLEELEKLALTDLQESRPVNKKLETMEQLSPDEAHQLEDYLDKLRLAATRKLGGEENPEVKGYFEEDLDEKRSQLAELTYRRINSPAVANWLRHPKNRKEFETVQNEYDESLRALGRRELTGIADDEGRQTKATEIALQEMFALRSAIDQQLHAQVEEVVEEKSGLQKARDWINRVSQKEILKMKITGKERHLRIGHVATFGAGFGIGVGVRLAMGATGALVAGTVAGAVAGGAIGGVRAHKNIKSGLLDSPVEAEQVALKESIGKGINLDEVLRDRLSGETSKAKKERLKKVVGRMGRAAAIGAGFGLGGSLLGVGAVAAGDWLAGGSTPGYQGGILGDLNIPDMEASAAESNGTEAPNQPFDDVPEIEPTPEPPTSQELLQQYAGENADAATTIEAGEGPTQTLHELGIPQEKIDGLLNNDALMEKLVSNGDAYSLQEAGVQDHGWGWTGNELSNESVYDLYEAADMTSTEAQAMAETGLPPTYAELSPDALSFAENHSVVTNIPSGMGGEELMRELRVDPQAWYAVEQDLLKAAPNDFYTMPDGHVGLSHTGSLSAKAVEELSKQLSQSNFARAA